MPCEVKTSVPQGLSNFGVDSSRPRSTSSERKIRKISTTSQPGIIGAKAVYANGYSTDETDSGKFTIGERLVAQMDD